MTRIFTSFAIEDYLIKELFLGQAKHDKVPYEFTDMSVKQPWDTSWKTNCRVRIKSCKGLIVLISKNLRQAEGAIWEIQCAKDEGIPILGVYMSGCGIADTPDQLDGVRKVSWTWQNIASFVNHL